MMRYIPLVFLIVLALACFLLPQVFNVETATDLNNRLMPSSSAHLLGTDELGRDIFFRLLQGGQISLSVGICAALLCALIGTITGLYAGYFGGWRDAMLMRMADALISLPTLPLLIILSAIDPQKIGISADFSASARFAILKIVVLVALFGWMPLARLVRARTLTLKNSDFVLSARALGVGHRNILLRHILPNLLSTIIVATTLATGGVIMAESILSFLGLGIAPPIPSWGNMLTGAENLIWEAPRLMVWPGLAIFTTVLALNLVGDHVQDLLNPTKN